MQSGYKNIRHSGINTNSFVLGTSSERIISGDLISFDYGDSKDPVTNDQSGILSPIIFVMGTKDKNLVGCCLSYIIHQIQFEIEGEKSLFGKSVLGEIYTHWLNHYIDYSIDYQEDGEGLRFKEISYPLLPKTLSNIFGKYSKILGSLIRYYNIRKIRNSQSFRKSDMVIGKVFKKPTELIIPLDIFVESRKGFIKRAFLPRV